MKKSRKMWNYLIISHLKAKESSLIWYNPYFVIDHISIPGTGMEIACYAGEYHKKEIKRLLGVETHTQKI